ncbi:ankyrin repeat containing protein [Finch poxvirus]|uniref:Ankyrin repeat containing protein n=1 Tax=Condorpox virus TaxID=3049970 RepID=A0AAT9UQD2_9POXV|nr:ankyrin repeat containing protein [Finch poxvirus]UOX39070.1 ankyrin repeat containing protein [Finch poxvirus]
MEVSIFEAIESGSLSSVLDIIKTGIDLNVFNDFGCSPLHCAVENERFEIAEALLSAGADPDIANEEASSPLHRAVKIQNIDLVKLLLDHGANVDTYEDYQVKTPLQYAVCIENVEIVKLLLDYNADVDEEYRHNHPIIEAIKRENLEIIDMLLKAGSSINYGYRGYMYPLHYAVKSESIDIVEQLLLSGAFTNVKDNHRMTPLHYATCVGSVEIASILLGFGADINAKDRYWNSPLWYAVENENVEMVEMLLTSWADTTIASSSCFTPLSNTKFDTPEGNAIAKLLISNIVVSSKQPKHYVENFEHIQSDLENMEKNPIMKSYMEECKSEIEKIENTLLGSEKVSLLDIWLKLDYNTITKYVGCINTDELKIYKELIDTLVEEGKKRREMIDQSMKSLENTFSGSENDKTSWIHLPIEIRYSILESMDSKDLPL